MSSNQVCWTWTLVNLNGIVNVLPPYNTCKHLVKFLIVCQYCPSSSKSTKCCVKLIWILARYDYLFWLPALCFWLFAYHYTKFHVIYIYYMLCTTIFNKADLYRLILEKWKLDFLYLNILKHTGKKNYVFQVLEDI